MGQSQPEYTHVTYTRTVWRSRHPKRGTEASSSRVTQARRSQSEHPTTTRAPHISEVGRSQSAHPKTSRSPHIGVQTSEPVYRTKTIYKFTSGVLQQTKTYHRYYYKEDTPTKGTYRPTMTAKTSRPSYVNSHHNKDHKADVDADHSKQKRTKDEKSKVRPVLPNGDGATTDKDQTRNNHTPHSHPSCRSMPPLFTLPGPSKHIRDLGDLLRCAESAPKQVIQLSDALEDWVTQQERQDGVSNRDLRLNSGQSPSPCTKL